MKSASAIYSSAAPCPRFPVANRNASVSPHSWRNPQRRFYVLDEPTIGLHARDNEQLLDVLKTPAPREPRRRG